MDATGTVTFKTRHNEDHKAWTPTKDAITFFAQFPESVFVFELLHSKGGNVRDTLYLFDVLRLTGKDFVGQTLIWRLAQLGKCFLKNKSANIVMAHTYTSDLKELYDGLVDPLDEGIVLKDPKAILRTCFRDSMNSSWQVKCRRATQNYSF